MADESKALTAIKASIAGNKADEVIKSGTLVVTRGIGVIAIGLIGTFIFLTSSRMLVLGKGSPLRRSLPL